jgi:hypothetical protein
LAALQRCPRFKVIDQRTIWKIDFIVRRNRPFSEVEFKRRRPIGILGPRLQAATPEDLLIARLEWAARATPSGKSGTPPESSAFSARAST